MRGGTSIGLQRYLVSLSVISFSTLSLFEYPPFVPIQNTTLTTQLSVLYPSSACTNQDNDLPPCHKDDIPDVVDTLLTFVDWLSTNGVCESPMIICFTESQGGLGGMVSFLNSIVIVVSLICSLFKTKDKKQNVVIRKMLDQNTYFILSELN
jgi:hypothetical protein